MQSWSELSKVQPLASKIMINSIKKRRLSHAYLIQGSRGTGKEMLAQLIAMTFFCVNRKDVEPCQECHMCKRIASKNHPDVHWIEPEGASIKNEQIDHLRKEFAYTGLESFKKVYIINHSEALTVNAANRILKFLEEPNIESTAILLTDNGQSILPTIRSRCQIIDLQPLNELLFIQTLVEEDASISEKDAKLLSALTKNIDEAIDFHREGKIYEVRNLVLQFMNVIVYHYQDRYLFTHQQWFTQLKEKQEQELGLELLLLAIRDMIQQKIGNEQSLLFFQPNDALLNESINHFSQERLLRMVKTLLEAKQRLKQNVHPTLVMEQFVLQI